MMDGNTFVLGSCQIGQVASVSGSQVVVLLDDALERSMSGTLPALPKGTLIKIGGARTWVYGLVTAVSMPMPAHDRPEDALRFAELVLLGEIELDDDGQPLGPFQRGVSFFPSVGDRVLTTTPDDLALVYARPASAAVQIGTIHQDRSIPAYISPDNLLGKHFAILGTTGSGKSCAAALIVRRIIEAHANAHVVLLDPHNEYAQAFRDYAELVDSETLELPYWLFTFEELAPAILGTSLSAGEALAEATILGDLVVKAKLLFPGNTERASQITLHTPVPYKMSDLLDLLDREMGRLNNTGSVAPYMHLKSRINSMRSDSRFRFMFGGISVYDNMAKILARLLRLPVAGKPITILDLSAVPSEVLNIVVSVLCRLTFDFALFSDRAVPILLVCEEAHRYLPEDSKQGFEPTKRILSRVAREGRKYGVSLCIVSQRPSDLAISALSQCNTVFSLRLSSVGDQNFVRAMLPDWGGGLFDFLPSLRNGEAVVIGEGIAVPARVRFDTLPPEHVPRCGTACFSRAWQNDQSGRGMIDAVVSRWRTER
jgi:hypothetical protein